MSMVRITPVEVRVQCGLFDGRPRVVHVGQEVLPVVGVACIRDERSAYPAAVGPRTVFEVQTTSSRLALTFEHRRRRWSLEGVDPERTISAAA